MVNNKTKTIFLLCILFNKLAYPNRRSKILIKKGTTTFVRGAIFWYSGALFRQIKKGGKRERDEKTQAGTIEKIYI
jgi:hypothetical protein